MAKRAALVLTLCAFALGLLVLFPAVDLWVSGLFYRPGEGFFLAEWEPFRLLHRGTPYLVAAMVLASATLGVLALWRRRPVLGLDARGAVYLLVVLGLGPGIVVNSFFKDHWGRARPAQVAAFGGSEKMTPAFVPSDQCERNCSFPAGDPAVGFSFVAVAFLAAVRRTRGAIFAGALALGGLLGVARIAQGGHFLSDVLASAFFVIGLAWLLHHAMRASSGASLMRHASALRRLAIVAVATAAAAALAMAFLDRPLALLAHRADPVVVAVFRFITGFGLAGPYLVVAGVFALAAAVAARRVRDPDRAARLRCLASQTEFLFAAVALSGIAADLMKPFFGRARPPLLFSDGIYGFTWHGARALYWSFPSGHAVTAASLATVLYLIAPRSLPLYLAFTVLVAASRIVIGAHYLSDVLVGAFLGVAVTWALSVPFAAIISDSRESRAAVAV